MRKFYFIVVSCIALMALSCRNQEPRYTESGQGDNFDQNHPMPSENPAAADSTNSSQTDPTAPVMQ